MTKIHLFKKPGPILKFVSPKKAIEDRKKAELEKERRRATVFRNRKKKNRMLKTVSKKKYMML